MVSDMASTNPSETRLSIPTEDSHYACESLKSSGQSPKVLIVEVPPSRTARTIGPIVIASALLAPLLLLPYFATRYRLQRAISELDKLKSVPSTLTRLEDNLLRQLREAGDVAADVTKQWSSRIDRAEKENKRLTEEVHRFQAVLDRLAMRVDSESELAKFRASQPPQREVKLITIQEDPRISSEVLGEIGYSLSNIAAFMEEIEIKNGMSRKGVDPRGIERMRVVALRLEKLAKH